MVNNKGSIYETSKQLYRPQYCTDVYKINDKYKEVRYLSTSYLYRLGTVLVQAIYCSRLNFLGGVIVGLTSKCFPGHSSIGCHVKAYNEHVAPGFKNTPFLV